MAGGKYTKNSETEKDKRGRGCSLSKMKGW
jgi:hypothetical protein